MNDANLDPARVAGVAVFVFGSIAMKRGGLTRAILSRIRLYAQAGINVRLLLTEPRISELREEADIRKAWSLPDSVEIRYFWREMTPGGAGAPVDRLVAAREEPGHTAFPTPAQAGEAVRFFRAGLPAKTKYFTDSGQLHHIKYLDEAGRVRSDEYFEADGGLVYTDQIDVATGKPALRRWFDSSGQIWLTTWKSPWGKASASVRHLPQLEVYDDFGEVIASWVDEILANDVAPIVFSDSRGQDRVLLALRHPGVRTVAVLHNCHTNEPYTANAPIKEYWSPLLENIGAFDTIVSLTHRQRDDVASRFGGSNHIVINHPSPNTEVAQIPRATNRLVAVARISRQKRLEDAIRAFSLAAWHVPGAHFDIYGTGIETTKLEKLVRRLDMGDRIHFRGFTDRPLEVFAGATAAVLSSRFEGLPLVLNEAMGVGTPFIAYDINYGPAEVIRHEVDGLLVPSGDVQAMSEAMVRVLTDPEFAAALSERAREVKERFSVSRWHDEWMALFVDLVRKTPSTDPHDPDSMLTERAAREASRRSLSETSSPTTT